jgi:hypothetical protein
MGTCLHWTGVACVLGAVLAWFAATKNYLSIRSELSRVVRTYELMPGPGQGGALSLNLLLQANAVPQAEATRRKLVRMIAIFLVLCAAATTVVAADCAQPATSMNEPWFWLLTVAVLATLVSTQADIRLPIRRQFGYAAIAVGAALAVTHLYVLDLYTTRLPQLPQLATGNLIPLNSHGSLVFITQWQSSMLIWLQFGAVVAALCGAVIVRFSRPAGMTESRLRP